MIKRIQIKGERCSGTNYLQGLLEINFDNITIVSHDYGWKHFFPINLEKNDHDDCLFIVIFRNVFDWLSSFHNCPHHVDQRLKNISFSDFIRKEWVCIWNEDAEIKPNDTRYNTEMLFERNPETNERFENILEMRSAKIKSFLSLSDQVKNTYFIRYEDLKKNPDILKDVANRFGIRLKNDKIVDLKTKANIFNGRKLTYKKKNYPRKSTEDRAFIRNHVDSKLEHSAGYKIVSWKDYFTRHRKKTP